jgi:glycosyltransferase involved in cell wall biosynthesis
MTKTTKTIVIDCLSALQGGGQTYLMNLFRFLPHEFRNSLRVIAIIPVNADTLMANEQIEYIHPIFASRNIVCRYIWVKFMLPALLRQKGTDVLYCPGGFVSVFSADWKTAVAFRNMLPFDDVERRRYSYGYTRARLNLLRFIQSRSFRTADLVVFISQFGRSIIDITVGPTTGRSIVIPHGISEQFNKSMNRPAGLALPDNYVAYVSILNVYKAQVEVVREWALMKQKRQGPEKLLLVGPENRIYADKVRAVINELGMQDEVIILGNVAHDTLPAIYQGAVANIFASSCENCPNILLEALASGKPVLCSDYQPMPEFAGNAALYFDPYKPDELAKLLCLILDDQNLQMEMGEKARAQSVKFQWKRSADETWKALIKLAGGSRSE